MSKYKISKYVFFFHFENLFDYVAVFHAVSMEIIYIKKEIFNEIQQNINCFTCNNSMVQIFNELREKKIIILEKENENNLICVTSNHNISPTTLRLQLTDKCNLDCSYCQIEKNYKHNKGLHMSEDIAIRSLYLFNKFSQKNIQKSIILTGGEPLLNFNIIKLIIKKAKEIFDSYRIILFTNGIGITEEIAKVLKDNNVLVLVSLDGQKEQHNLLRKDVSGNGTFEKSLIGYNICKNLGCNIGISCVVNTHNIKELEKEVINFFIKLHPDSIGLNFPHYLLFSDNSNLLAMEEYADAIINVFKKLRNYGIYLENITRMIEPFVKQKINTKECAALGRGITVLPNGTVGPCKTMLVAEKIGVLLDDIEKIEKIDDSDVFSIWSNRSTYTLDCCKGCFAISLCGSGCTYDSYVINGDINGIDKRTCILTKKIIDFLIIDLFRIIKNRTKNDFDILIPTLNERNQIYSTVIVNDFDLKRSAGHEL